MTNHLSERIQKFALGAEMKGVDDLHYSFLGDVTAGQDAAHSGARHTASHRKNPGEEGVTFCHQVGKTETAQNFDSFLSFRASVWSPSASGGPLVLTYYVNNRHQVLLCEASFLHHH